MSRPLEEEVKDFVYGLSIKNHDDRSVVKIFVQYFGDVNHERPL